MDIINKILKSRVVYSMHKIVHLVKKMKIVFVTERGIVVKMKLRIGKTLETRRTGLNYPILKETKRMAPSAIPMQSYSTRRQH